MNEQIAGRKLKIVYQPPDKLKPDPNNARTHTPKQIDLLAKAITEFGFTNPILLRPDGMVGAGHGRLEAALKVGLKVVPTITIDGLTENQWRAYVLADNQLALTGTGWKKDQLLSELTQLKAFDYDLSLTGFSEFEFTKFGVPGYEIPNADPASTNQVGEMKYAVIVRCKDEAEQLAFLDRFNEEGITCEALIS